VTEKEKRARVINGLENCLSVGGCDEGCPYHDDIDTTCSDCLADALKLLKAQEPHVVTIADYENNPNVDKDGNLAVWRESRHLNGIAYHNDGWVILNRNRVEGWFNSEMIRFWTSRPTDEQRGATQWTNEEEEET
jgi:hypothetical protein